MVRRNPKKLSSGENNTVIAISENEVGKLFLGDTRSDIGSESEKMKYANNVNGLVVKFIRLETDETSDMLVMERLYPMDYRAFEMEKRELWFSVFEDELHELHKAGFVHRDIKRPAEISGMPYDNVFLTETGLRLIDLGVSVLKKTVGDKLFDKYVKEELVEVKEFKEFFINR